MMKKILKFIALLFILLGLFTTAFADTLWTSKSSQLWTTFPGQGLGTTTINVGGCNGCGATGGTVTSITATAPLTGGTITTSGSIGILKADGSTNGYLSSGDWTTFNSKQSALTIGNLTDAGTDGITVGSGTGAVIGSGTTIAQHVADTTHNGYLTSTDWNTFNSKLTSTLAGADIFVGNGSNIATGVAMSGDTTINNTGVVAIGANKVTYAKFQQVAASSLLGNPTGSLANASEITLGSGLAFSGTTLTASGSGGTVTSITAGTGLGGGTITTSGTITNNLSIGVSGGQTAIGGTAATDHLSLQSTSGVGTTDYINFLVGNNGATEAMRILHGGNVSIGTTSSAGKVYVGVAPTASANYGTVSIGSGAFDGSTSGKFAGSSSGTSIATNEVSGYAGNLMDLQENGVSMFSIGNELLTLTGASNTPTATQILKINNTNTGVPRTLEQGGISSSDGNWLIRFADAYSSSSTQIGSGFQVTTNNDPNFTNVHGFQVYTTTSNTTINTFNGSASNGDKLVFSTAAALTAGLTIDTVANSQKVYVANSLVVGSSTATSTFNVGSSQQYQVNSSGLVAKYNAISTVSNGTPSEYATIDLTAHTAAISATTAYAVPSTGLGLYRACFVSTITTAASTSSVLGGTNGFQFAYTDGNDSVVKTTPTTMFLTSAANTTGTTISGCAVMYAKASTNIQYITDYTSVGVTAMQYNYHLKVEAL